MPSIARYLVLAALAVTASQAVPATAAAQGSLSAYRRVAAARRLGIEAVKFYNAGKFALALDKFERAYQLHAVPTIGVKLADCMAHIGRLVDAAEVYRETARYKLQQRDSWRFRRALEEAKKKRSALLPRIPELTIELKGPVGSGTEVRLNGRTLPDALLGAAQPVDPGKLRLEVRRIEGDIEIKKTVTIKEGAKRTVQFALPPIVLEREVEDEPSDHLKPVWISSFAVAGLGALAAIINGSIAVSQNATLEDNCPNRNCPPSQYGRLDVYDATRIGTTVGLVLAGAGAAAGGLTLWLGRSESNGKTSGKHTAPNRAGQPSRSHQARIRIRPSSIAVSVDF